jgi:hypothetical protein
MKSIKKKPTKKKITCFLKFKKSPLDELKIEMRPIPTKKIAEKIIAQSNFFK